MASCPFQCSSHIKKALTLILFGSQGTNCSVISHRVSITFFDSGTNLFVILDLVVKNDAIGSLGLLPGERNTVPGRLLLPDDSDW